MWSCSVLYRLQLMDIVQVPTHMQPVSILASWHHYMNTLVNKIFVCCQGNVAEVGYTHIEVSYTRPSTRTVEYDWIYGGTSSSSASPDWSCDLSPPIWTLLCGVSHIEVGYTHPWLKNDVLLRSHYSRLSEAHTWYTTDKLHQMYHL